MGFVARRAIVAGVLLLTSCKDDAGPTAPVISTKPPALEAVNYELLGSGRLIFSREGVSVAAVYTVDGSSRTSSGRTSDHVPETVSPDGKLSAWLSFTDLTRAYDLFAGAAGEPGKRFYGVDGNSEGPPAWSVDGAHIVAPVNPFANNELPYLVVYDPVANRLDKFAILVPSGPYVNRIRGPVSMSRSGSVVFSMDGNANGIVAAASTNSTLRVLIPDTSASAFAPAFSNDGLRIAYVEGRDTNGGIGKTVLVVMNADGTGRQELATVVAATPTRSHPGAPDSYSVCWLPGDKRIVFNAPDGGIFEMHIYIYDFTTQVAARMTSASGSTDSSITCGAA